MKTQQAKILNHLRTRGKITSVEAIGLYGVTRLADVVFKLKKRDHKIVTTMRRGVLGNYAEYRMADTKKLAA